MVRTNNGFEIADVDLKLRGPGDLAGTQQSGVIDLIFTDLSQDSELVKIVREQAQEILNQDADLDKQQNQCIKAHLLSFKNNTANWSRIS
jgi:ATP-dependent DNA helicase RecG